MNICDILNIHVAEEALRIHWLLSQLPTGYTHSGPMCPLHKGCKGNSELPIRIVSELQLWPDILAPTSLP